MRLRPKARRIGRSLAAGLAIAAVLAQLGSIAHLAIVQHVECADHGELVEVSPDSQHDLAADESIAHVHSDGSATHGHDHCLLAALRRARARWETTQVATADAPVASASQSLPPAIAPPPAITLLALAPKSSPPSA